VIRSAELRNRANPHAARARLLGPSNSCRIQGLVGIGTTAFITPQRARFRT
jgi:hypothetical protein